MPRYDYAPFEYIKPAGLRAPEPRKQVVIIGAGPIGLAMAIDLALKDIPSVVLDDNNVVSVGSRAICWAKRTLEIFDRLGVGKRMLEKGVTWKVGRLFHGADEVYNFDLLPEEGHTYPAFINLQQYYVEQYLVERAQEFPDLIDLRFKNKVTAHHDRGDHVELDIETPDGSYTLEADYMLACDGAGSATRKRMALSFEGQTFEEQFLIVDVEMEESPFGSETPERWFWFEPEFHQGQSALLHKQPDNIYRIDLQLGPEANAHEEAKEESVIPRIKAMVGDKPFEIDWKSVYKFRCARLERFVHNRVIFVGDSAHVVSPFGARGGNGGIQDADNLGWKLAMVLKGEADQALLESYNDERVFASEENIKNSSRATNFMTPKSETEHVFRSQVLKLAKDMPFARLLVNSGRLSLPCVYDGIPSNDEQAFDGPQVSRPGAACPDAILDEGYLLNHLGDRFLVLTIKGEPIEPFEVDGIPIHTMHINEPNLHLASRYLGDNPQAVYLIRPDQHIAGRWNTFSNNAITAAVLHTIGRG